MRAEVETDQTRFSVVKEICFSPANADGCIILDVLHDRILSLNNTGALIFAKLAGSENGMSRQELLAALIDEFAGVAPHRIGAAIDKLLTQLDEKKVLKRKAVRRGPNRVRVSLSQTVVVCVNVLVTPLLLVKAYNAAAILLLSSADVVLKLGGFSTLHKTVKQWRLRGNSSDDQGTIVRGCATVERACIWHPKQKLCLQRSAVTTWLLRSLGIPAEMVIGVHKMPFYGHSWVEVDGRVVNDHKNVQTFFHVLSRC